MIWVISIEKGSHVQTCSNVTTVIYTYIEDVNKKINGTTMVSYNESPPKTKPHRVSKKRTQIHTNIVLVRLTKDPHRVVGRVRCFRQLHQERRGQKWYENHLGG